MTQPEGEHELVLGNKQLLSAFFVVVILLGVFFTMGYFVGKNTATSGFNNGQSVAVGGTRPDAAGKQIDPPVQAPAETPTRPTETISSDPPPRVDAKPVTPPPPVAEEKPAPKPETPPAEAMAQPTSEQKYLQVSAIRRPDADNMVKVLKERGFPALLGESSKAGLYRVLVGPFKTTSELGHAKADLKTKGFDSIVAK